MLASGRFVSERSANSGAVVLGVGQRPAPVHRRYRNDHHATGRRAQRELPRHPQGVDQKRSLHL